MNEVKKNHSKWLHIRLTEEEYDNIHNKFEASTCRKTKRICKARVVG